MSLWPVVVLQVGPTFVTLACGRIAGRPDICHSGRHHSACARVLMQLRGRTAGLEYRQGFERAQLRVPRKGAAHQAHPEGSRGMAPATDLDVAPDELAVHALGPASLPAHRHTAAAQQHRHVCSSSRSATYVAVKCKDSSARAVIPRQGCAGGRGTRAPTHCLPAACQETTAEALATPFAARARVRLLYAPHLNGPQWAPSQWAC